MAGSIPALSAKNPQMDNKNFVLRKLPSVDVLLSDPDFSKHIGQFGKEVVKFCIRKTLNEFRKEENQASVSLDNKAIKEKVKGKIESIFSPGFKHIINSSGILIHTNLGRAPLGQELLKNIEFKLSFYNNLEFDLQKGKRGNRHDLISGLISFLTKAEDALVVNNNAAAILLILKSFAEGKEVIVSRSELIEIGGSFRLPEIMKAAGCELHEVGTSNKTHFSDYENAINENTALIFKTHKSNYSIKGFTHEVDLKELAVLARKKRIPLVYDLGSGLPFPQKHPILKNEPDVKTALRNGATMVCFSGDKLLGGPQAGIIAGKKRAISKLKRNQLTRALRVGKLTIGALEEALKNYLSEEKLKKGNLFMQILYQDHEQLLGKARKISELLNEHSIRNKITKDFGLFGGGTLPDEKIASFSVEMDPSAFGRASDSSLPRRFHHLLLQQKTPVLAVLKKGKIYLNVLCIMDHEIESLVSTVLIAHQSLQPID